MVYIYVVMIKIKSESSGKTQDQQYETGVNPVDYKNDYGIYVS